MTKSYKDIYQIIFGMLRSVFVMRLSEGRFFDGLCRMWTKMGSAEVVSYKPMNDRETNNGNAKQLLYAII